LVVAGTGTGIALALSLGVSAAGCGLICRIGIVPYRALHCPIKRFGPVWRGWVRLSGLSCDGKDPILRHPQMINPSLHVLPCWPTLPPGGQCLICIQAQRLQQVTKKIIKAGFARWRVLLLLY